MQNDHNVSADIPTNKQNKSIPELYKNVNIKPNHYKKKSLQYAMKRSRLNDLIKSNISVDGGGIVPNQPQNERSGIKLSLSKDRKGSRYSKRLKDFRTSFGNTRNRNYNLYPYETHQRTGGSKKIRNTIYSDNVIVNNNFGLKIANNYMKPSRKLIQSVDGEKFNFDRKKMSLDRLNVKLK